MSSRSPEVTRSFRRGTSAVATALAAHRSLATSRTFLTMLAAAAVATLAACRSEARPTDSGPFPPATAGATVVTSDLLAGEPRPVPVTVNPYQANEHVLAEGKRLYGWFNCAGCHGPEGGGGIGPPFLDGDWIYGGTPGNIYQSIVQGRPNGMPSFAPLSDDQVWQLVAYLQSLDPGKGRSSGGGGGSGGGAGEGGTQGGGGRD